MDNSTVLPPGAVALDPNGSTTLKPDAGISPSGGGAPRTVDDDSIENILASEIARLRAEDEAADTEAKERDKSAAKPKEPAKPADPKADASKPEKDKGEDGHSARQRGENGKFAKADQGEPAGDDGKAPAPRANEGADRRQAEGRHPEPPARFLPEARAKWQNVPNEVKAEVHRVAQEYEREGQEMKAAHERYSQLREFDDLARRNGRDLRDSLVRLNEVENTIRRDPIAGLEAVLREVGPRFSDGSPLSLYDVADFLVKNGPEAYQRRVSALAQPGAPMMPQPSAGQGANPEIEALRAELNAMRADQTIVPVVAEFERDHPDFGALSEKIEQILKSGVIEKLYGPSLPLKQRLSEAYRMAGGQAPSSRSDADAGFTHSAAPAERPVNPDAGKKSVRGAPADGVDHVADDDPDSDLDSLLRRELRKAAAKG